MVIGLLAPQVVMQTVAAETTETGYAKEIQYIALGDSIAKGYTFDKSKLNAYPMLIQQHISQGTNTAVVMVNKAKSGISTAKLNEGILSDEETLKLIRNADIITVTVGANDLMDEFKSVCQEILGRTEKFQNLNDALALLETQVTEHPTLIFKAIGVLGNWDYKTFEDNWQTTMGIIADNKKDTAQVVVTNIYNPVSNLGLPGTLNKVVNSIINKMNQIIEDNEKKYEYSVVNLFDSDITKYVQEDGLHPNQEGQQMIADAVIEQLKMVALTESSQEQIQKVEKKGAANTVTAEMKTVKQSDKNKVTVWIISCILITGILLITLGLVKRKNKKSEK